MKLRALFRAPIILCALTPLCHLAAQQGQPIGGYQLLNTIVLPSGLAGNDISWVDTANARYYLADRGNTSASPAVGPRVDVINTATNQFLTSIPLTVASNGILAIPRAHELWVGLNDSTVAVIDTTTNAITHVISTGGKSRADELAFDPDDDLILIANDRDSPPFLSFISTDAYSLVKTLPFDGTSAPKSTGGIEQTVWVGLTGKFYTAIPATSNNANGEIDEIDPITKVVTRSFPTACKGPSGLVVIPNGRLMTACGDVLDVQSGKVVTTVAKVSGDEIWYNSGDQRVYFGGSQNVYVVDANSYSLLTTLVVGVPAVAPAPAQSTHSLAADSFNNEVFVAVSASGTGTGSGVGIQVWRNGATLTITPNPVAVTDGSDGTATITWNAPNASVIEVHVLSPTGPLFARYGNRGRALTGAWVSEGLTFYLQDVSNGQAPGPQNTLATAVAHLTQ